MAVQPPLCDFGWKAIGFDLPGVDGKTHTLADIQGPNGTLIIFMCNHCPYVLAVLQRLIRDVKDLQALGIGVAAINANDPAQYPEDSFDNMVRMASDNGFSFPYLFDESQEVARAYGAVCTPDFFGFNADLGLQYRGRLDASRRETGPEDAKRELFEAMQMVAKTGQGPSDQIASMGCSIKWRNED
ncbi:thioredoxin family protein [Magnetovibrio blakemorei]|uniref:Alkyl hydroperoxide reductase n=1 Tax=Magnetovibrio blakemorei TaxID=28181 RepID=A0A1E5QA67_9PROT|nr:thioredoxin family protein [Magnetovibrio blakemorei]OEJ68538.1 alkyl hydroperoxide reductase [Magnetovibrio blakemorei]